MTIPRSVLEQVKRGMPISNVLHDYGLEFRLSGNKLRGPCPECGGSDRATKCVLLNDYAYCHGCGFKGDVLDIIMMMERTNLRGAFELLGGNLKIAKSSRGTPLPALTKPRIDAPEDHENANRTYWDSLAKRNQVGERFLRERGIQAHSDLVRYDRGDPCLPLRSLDDGRIINVLRRRVDTKADRKVLLKRGSGYGCFGNVQHLGETFGEIIITEGWADYLTALALSTENLVIGARDAGSIPRVVNALACIAPGRCMALVMHPDAAGRTAVYKAIASLGDEDVDRLFRVLVPNTGDLNDTWMEAACGNR